MRNKYMTQAVFGSRYVLVDFLHTAHRFMKAKPLSSTMMVGGEMTTVDTTLPNYTIKNVYRTGGQGMHYTGVFLEGGNGHRKEYFKDQAMPTGKNATNEYKGGRVNPTSPFYKGVDLAVHLMHTGGVSLYRQPGFEADDCIIAMVKKIKSIDTETPIDIITNDSDLLALVDDQVSVYMRGTRQHAEPGCPEHRLYFQVTPETWEEYLSYTSAYRDYYIPYNSMILFKLIKGDKADNITGACKGYGGKTYTALMEQMVEDGVDFPNIFRYGLDFNEVIKPVLINYFDEETVDYMGYIYNGINPRYVNLEIPKQIDLGKLQTALLPLRINLV